MTPARPLAAALVGVLVGIVGWALLSSWSARGGEPPPLPWTAAGGTAALALAVVAAGRPVRRWVQGRRSRPLDPLVAARIAVFAKAAVYGGAALGGWYAAQASLLLHDLVGERRTRLVIALSALAAAIALSVAGLVVQRWCRVPPDDRSGPGDPG